jgi:hypothetical protein
MLEETLCLKIMRLKIRATHEILRSMFLSHDRALGAIPTSEVQNEMIIMGHQISSCHVPVVRSFFIL